MDCPIRFPGQYYDPESGLHYNRHRYYDPDNAQYLPPDPLGLAGGLRPQGYVDNPNTHVDPLGLASCPTEDVANSTGVPKTVASARARQLAMLEDNVGFNISPTAWDQYPTIGRNGTFVTDRQGAMRYFEGLNRGSEATVSHSTASQIEKDMGLVPGTLQDGFKVRQVTGLRDLNPTSPLEGNQHFLGSGNHLPGGAPEMMIRSIHTTDNGFATTIFNIKVGP